MYIEVGPFINGYLQCNYEKHRPQKVNFCMTLLFKNSAEKVPFFYKKTTNLIRPKTL
jgi:hypothetical protein